MTCEGCAGVIETGARDIWGEPAPEHFTIERRHEDRRERGFVHRDETCVRDAEEAGWTVTDPDYAPPEIEPADEREDEAALPRPLPVRAA